MKFENASSSYMHSNIFCVVIHGIFTTAGRHYPWNISYFVNMTCLDIKNVFNVYILSGYPGLECLIKMSLFQWNIYPAEIMGLCDIPCNDYRLNLQFYIQCIYKTMQA